MTHVMIDLETLGTVYHAPVLSIGAIEFNPNTGELGKKFYARIDIADAVKHGRASGDTIRWWLSQSDEARQELITARHSATHVFEKFDEYVRAFGGDVKVWGNGATFDISILEFAFSRVLKKVAPWKFWNVRDCRTVKDLATGLVSFEVERIGTHHNALDDAIHQARWVSNAWMGLRGKQTHVDILS